MRKLNLRPAEEAQAIDLTPMLDVVFIMLIFFIVTASFIKTPGVEIDKVETVSADKAKPAILVGVNAKNEIWIDKNFVKDNGVKIQIMRLHTENPKGGLVIQVDSEASIEKVALIADAARDVGINDVSVSTLND
ncbi:MAG: biopolymer transporter ExbD [Cycloclasticus sp.]|jgi:biopolymer transport protein ExbD|nr:biopolymer transporter ExbD [Cycloclasticus sp.]HIL92893.1 biopolymer transporter ExbD [Cycloclasticus sp.]